LILQEILPNSGLTHEVLDITSEALQALYPKVPGFRFNYVISPGILDADSDLATTPLDRLVLKHIRSQSDLIVTTGLTAIAEVLNSSSFAPMLILTRSDDEFDIPALKKESSRAVYVTQRLETSYSNSKAMAIGKVQNSLPEFCVSFCELNHFGSVVLESGLAVAAEFSQAGLLAEVDVTVTGVDSQQVAEEFAYEFITNLKPKAMVHQQLLRHEYNWFFRFVSPKASH
jgi:riboflavin biosynthesis pyrimidine reductase